MLHGNSLTLIGWRLQRQAHKGDSVKLVTGIDLLEIDRLQDAFSRQGERFLQRIFTNREVEENVKKTESLAGRFAAKEAVAKALGCGIGDVAWKEIEILRTDIGAPQLVLHGAAAVISKKLGIENWSISISHTKSCAIAMAVGSA